MQIFTYRNNNTQQILALGPESNGNFSFFYGNKLYFSEDFGDLLEDKNYQEFKKTLNNFIKKEGFNPDVILTDFHPLYKTTLLGQKLAKKYKARHIKIQHHLAHIFSAIGGKIIHDTSYIIPNTFYGIALDGTGYGTDEKIWGGEIFKFTVHGSRFTVDRVGQLENQALLGGDLAIKEPARILMGILAKFLSKNEIHKTIKNTSSSHDRRKMRNFQKFYTKQEFEFLYNQLQQNFNCIETSSTGRVLDAVSVLLGFAKNQRNYKHEPIKLLESNSTEPYSHIKPKVDIIENTQISNEFPMIKFPKKHFALNTTFLFEYLIKNLHKDNQRLAATAQLYIAQGLYEITQKSQVSNLACRQAGLKSRIFLAGGLANNKIISEYFTSRGAYLSQIIPRGDAGISFGQLFYYLLANQKGGAGIINNINNPDSRPTIRRGPFN